MIPLHLSIKGLYSYQERQEIDFTKLAQAQLFGIFGSTGSGKSSILEAITFALYGQSDRLNQRDNRGYNMMNLRSDRLGIEFRFLAEEVQYLFTVSGKRNSRRFEDVKTFERAAYRMEGVTPIPLEHSNAETILGLSYENFRRTIIVPQGKFQEFLQLTETERTRMMREIFHLERFELFHKTLVLERKVNLEVAQKESLIAQYQSASKESIEEKEEILAHAKQTLESLEKKRKESEKDFQQQEALQKLFVELNQQQEKARKLDAQTSQIQAREQQMTAYEQCLLAFKPLLDRKRELLQDQKTTESKIQQKRASQTQAQQELAGKELHFQRINEAYKNRDQWIQKAEELREVIRLKKVEANVQALAKRMADGKEKITILKQEIAQEKQEQFEREQQLKQLRENRPDIQQLIPIRDWYQKLAQAERRLTEAEQHLLQIQSRKEALDRHKHQLLSQSSVSSAQFSLPSPQLITLLNKRWEEEIAHIDQAKVAYDQALAHKKLEEFAERLEEGSPCPLCGAVHHPSPLLLDSKGEELEEWKNQIEASRKKSRQLETTIAKLEANRGQEKLLEQEWEDQQTRTQKIRAELDQQKNTFTWGDLMTHAHVNEQLETINQTDTLIREINLQQEALMATIQKKEETLEIWQKGLEKIGKDLQQEEVAFLSGKTSLKQISYNARKVDADASIEELALEYDQNYKRMEQSYQSVETQIKQLRSRRDTLAGEIKGLEEQTKSLYIQLAQKNLELDRALQQNSFQNLTEVEALLSLDLDIESEKRVIREFEQMKHATHTLLLSLQEKVKGEKFSEEAFLQLQHAIQELTQQRSELMVEMGSLQKELERLQQDLAFRLQQEDILHKLRRRADNLSVLKRMFHKSGFVNYVSTMYLQNLCAAANDRFMKLTRGSLSLETTESNSFLVRDYLNNGQTRSVKTLSGGQTFQAALSLALALADQVQQQAKSKQNFFFLDEGFGSQDKNALQVIFQTLKSLRQENRIVGIISHVEELQQEISAFLHIHNDPESGSKVKGSWE